METKTADYLDVAKALYSAALNYISESQSRTKGLKRPKGIGNETRLELMARTCGILAEDVLLNHPEIDSTNGGLNKRRNVPISKERLEISTLIHVSPNTFYSYMAGLELCRFFCNQKKQIVVV